MNTIELIVRGNVQRVGYRNIVSQAAFELGINGYVENLPDESVRIVVKGNEGKIREFINKIKIRKWPINVENIKQRKIPVKTSFKGFAILRGKPTKEMAERADEAALYMHKMYNEMHSFREETGKNLKQLEDTLGGKTDSFREETGKNLKQLESTLGGKTDAFRKETSENFKNLGTTLGGKTDAFRKETSCNFKRLESTLGGKTDAFRKETSDNFKNLGNTLGSKTDSFRQETSENFNKLDGKYGSVSSSLKSINGGIKRIDGNIKHIGTNIKENNNLLSKIAKRF